MKQPLALRIEADLLAAVRRCAQEENRNVTNFVETALKTYIATQSGVSSVSTAKQKSVAREYDRFAGSHRRRLERQHG